MHRKSVVGAALVTAALLSSPVLAQGTVGGAAQGANNGAAAGQNVGGPVGGIVGGVVGGAVGAATGTVNAILGIDQRPRFRSYVVEQHRPSYRYSEDVRVGAVLPESGVTYYDVPSEYGVKEYRYTVVNDRPVLVEPRSRRVVEVIE